jgi:hypothetical protein
LVAEYRPRADWRAPDLNQTEAIWQSFERLTRTYWTASYTEYKSGKSSYGRFPDWDILEP